MNTTLAPHIYPEYSMLMTVCLVMCLDGLLNTTLKSLKLITKSWGFLVYFGDSWCWQMTMCIVSSFVMRIHCYPTKNVMRLMNGAKIGKFFYIMQDDVSHNELILAGMWGGYVGVFPNIKADMQRYFSNLDTLNKTIDQQFLRNHIWVTVNQSVLVHDKFRLEKDSLPYPDYPLSDIEKIPYFHIGMVDAHAKSVITEITDTNATRVQWQLVNQHNSPICTYEADVITQNNRHIIKLYLPYFYTQKIEHEHWQIRTATLACPIT